MNQKSINAVRQLYGELIPQETHAIYNHNLLNLPIEEQEELAEFRRVIIEHTIAKHAAWEQFMIAVFRRNPELITGKILRTFISNRNPVYREIKEYLKSHNGRGSRAIIQARPDKYRVRDLSKLQEFHLHLMIAPDSDVAADLSRIEGFFGPVVESSLPRNTLDQSAKNIMDMVDELNRGVTIDIPNRSTLRWFLHEEQESGPVQGRCCAT